MAWPCGHVGIQFEVLAETPAPITWLTDEDGKTWLVGHYRWHPESIPEEAAVGLGLGIFERCPVLGEKSVSCCYFARQVQKKPDRGQAETIAEEFHATMFRIFTMWPQAETALGEMLDTAQHLTGHQPMQANIGFGEQPSFLLRYFPRRA